jgi:hypothetical protein
MIVITQFGSDTTMMPPVLSRHSTVWVASCGGTGLPLRVVSPLTVPSVFSTSLRTTLVISASFST